MPGCSPKGTGELWENERPCRQPTSQRRGWVDQVAPGHPDALNLTGWGWADRAGTSLSTTQSSQWPQDHALHTHRPTTWQGLASLASERGRQGQGMSMAINDFRARVTRTAQWETLLAGKKLVQCFPGGAFVLRQLPMRTDVLFFTVK